MKYFLVGLVVLVANCLLIYFLSGPVFSVLGWWFVVLALVEGWLVGKLTGVLLAEWHYRDTMKALEAEWERTVEPGGV